MSGHLHKAAALPLALLTAFLASLPLKAQEFDFGLLAPEAILPNSTFEVELTLTSRGIPAGSPGAQGWSLGVAHRNLTLLSVTTRGTAAEEFQQGGFALSEPASSSPGAPREDGFISITILSVAGAEATLPPGGTVTVARATYHAGETACLSGAGLAFQDGLSGTGQPVQNAVTWKSRTFYPRLGEKSYSRCEPNDYLLHLSLPGGLSVPLGEGARFTATVGLSQSTATASGWTLAVAHDAARLRLLGVSVEGTGIEALLDPEGYALFELTSGPGNNGFTARMELSPDGQKALPAPDHPLARARYEVLPVSDPLLVGTRLQVALGFAGSLTGSGGPLSNSVFPAGNLQVEPSSLEVEVLPPTRFIRGDAGGDGRVDLADPLAVLFYLFAGLEDVCLEGGNANNDARLDLTDAVFLLERLFLAPGPLPQPSPGCGTDPTFPSLGCRYSSCGP